MEADYRAALDRTSKAHSAVEALRGSVEPLGVGQPPEISAALRAAEGEAQQAWNAYIPVRDRYWATRWGHEGNPPKK
ncbi:hypothetical protein [Kitasatospora phosalacinea]|uniref:hypothetical protein n=1 Tax=Kitasatospora phosalacinea TaxID=2065 RepID=UPI00131BE8A9|nr:hypothetical protein [Kitasatospora phosalacinea]